MREVVYEVAVDTAETCLVVAPGGYDAWLSFVGKSGDVGASGKLRWRERRLGKEVPKSQQGTFFDEAKEEEMVDLAKEEYRWVV